MLSRTEDKDGARCLRANALASPAARVCVGCQAVLIHTNNEIGGIAEAAICGNFTRSCAQPNTLMHAACAPEESLNTALPCKNWQRLAAAVHSALDVFRTRTVFSYIVAKADYAAGGLKYKVLTDVLYRRNYFHECQGISLCTRSQVL